MKVCFYLQRRFAMIGHSLACLIKEQSSSIEVCGVAGFRPSYEFLQKQTDIGYTQLLLEEDVHKQSLHATLDMEYLSHLEKEYGTPNLWPHLYLDRVIMSGQLVREYPHDTPTLTHTEMLLRLQETGRALENFLYTEKPDVVVLSVIGSPMSSLLYTMARVRGIKTIVLDVARIGNRAVLSEDYHFFTGVSKRVAAQSEHSPHWSEAEKFLKEFRARPAPFYAPASITYNDQTLRRANLRFLHPIRFFRSFLWHAETLMHDLKRRQSPDYTDIYIWWAVWDKIKRKFRGLRGYNTFYTPYNPRERFAYFPLHFEPEIALLLFAPFYTDQISLIKASARSLPVGMKLYVKEHPAMVGYRTRAFYRSITEIPNVCLVPPFVSGQTMARDAAITITATGTAGWESLIFKKPVITFGDVFYNEIPGVTRCHGFEELPHIIKKALENETHDEEALLCYVSALLEDSVPADYMDLWVNAQSVEEIRNNEGMQMLAARLLEKITQSHSL